MNFGVTKNRSRPQSQQYNSRNPRPPITGPIGGHNGQISSPTIMGDSPYNSLRLQQQAETQRDAREWIESVLKTKLPSDNLHAALMDGVVLCRVINILKPGMIKDINTKDLPFVKMENISNFLIAARQLGLPSSETFQTVDLFEGKNMTAVAHTILTLARLVAGEFPSKRRGSQPESSSTRFVDYPPRPSIDGPPRMSMDSPRMRHPSTESIRRLLLNEQRQTQSQSEPPLPPSPSLQRSPSLIHRNLVSRLGFGGGNAEKDTEKDRREEEVAKGSGSRKSKDMRPTFETPKTPPPEPEQQFTEPLTDMINRYVRARSPEVGSQEPGFQQPESLRRPALRQTPSAPSLGEKSSAEPPAENADINVYGSHSSRERGRKISRMKRQEPPNVMPPRDKGENENLPQYRHVRDIFASMSMGGDSLSEEPMGRTVPAPPASPVVQSHSSRTSALGKSENSYRPARASSPISSRVDEMSMGEAGDILTLRHSRSIHSIAESIPESIPSIPDEEDEIYYENQDNETNVASNSSRPPSNSATPSSSIRPRSSPPPPPLSPRLNSYNRNSGQRVPMYIQTDAPPLPLSAGTTSYPPTPTKSPTDSGYGTTGHHRRPPSGDSASSRPVTPERHEHSDRLGGSHSLSSASFKRIPSRTKLPNHMRYQDKQQAAQLEPPAPVPASSASTPIPSPSGSTPLSKSKKMGSRGRVPDTAQKLILTNEEGVVMAQYQLGVCIGKGQFGAVYKALNLGTGEMVAVKRIKLEENQIGEIDSLMQEVHLLRSLSHPNVVKYEGFVKDDEFINIVLEYVENGSLLTTLKGFGNFPEKLVASYCVKILEGLVYLHDQLVVHCDLKAANILATNSGNVKLSDFGVSLNLKLREADSGLVAGTPNWMAPEVIELKGASTKSDIWSLGCTVIELLTGKPPYSDLISMSALFRIVEDDCPPLPENISWELRDFLTKCFQKKPENRPTARQLQGHDWIVKNWFAKTTAPETQPVKDYDGSLSRSSFRTNASTRSILPYGHSNRSEGSLMLNDDDSSYRYNNEESFFPLPSGTPPGSAYHTGNTPPGSAYHTGNTPPTSSQLRNFPISIAGGVPPPRSNTASSQSTHGIQPSATPPRAGWFSVNGTPPRSVFGQQQQVRGSISGDQFRPPLEHRFVKSSFARSVPCKVCSEPVKRNAMFCEVCTLICHDRCKYAMPCTGASNSYHQPLNDVNNSPILPPLNIPSSSPILDSPLSTPRSSTSLSSRPRPFSEPGKGRPRKFSTDINTYIHPVPALPVPAPSPSPAPAPQPSASSSTNFKARTRKISKVFTSVAQGSLGNQLKDLANRNRSRELLDSTSMSETGGFGNISTTHLNFDDRYTNIIVDEPSSLTITSSKRFGSTSSTSDLASTLGVNTALSRAASGDSTAPTTPRAGYFISTSAFPPPASESSSRNSIDVTDRPGGERRKRVGSKVRGGNGEDCLIS